MVTEHMQAEQNEGCCVKVTDVLSRYCQTVIPAESQGRTCHMRSVCVQTNMSLKILHSSHWLAYFAWYVFYHLWGVISGHGDM